MESNMRREAEEPPLDPQELINMSLPLLYNG
jgi:hypothetical protein